MPTDYSRCESSETESCSNYLWRARHLFSYMLTTSYFKPTTHLFGCGGTTGNIHNMNVLKPPLFDKPPSFLHIHLQQVVLHLLHKFFSFVLVVLDEYTFFVILVNMKVILHYYRIFMIVGLGANHII